MDVLFPSVGEIIGGSQREERLDELSKRMDDMHISKDDLSWYLDTRRFGSVVHSGFGLGLERLVQFITGMKNIRETIAFLEMFRSPSILLFPGLSAISIRSSDITFTKPLGSPLGERSISSPTKDPITKKLDAFMILTLCKS